MQNYDIVCFQECFMSLNMLKGYIVEEAYKKGFKFFAQATEPGLFNEMYSDGGLTCISRYPIIKSDFHLFKTIPASSCALAMKGLLYCKFDLSSIGGNYLHTFSTHLQSSHLNDRETLSSYVDTYVQRYE